MRHTETQKNRRRAGFTLAETLLAVMILLLVTAIVAAGIPSARNAYEKVVMTSNADVLLSTTISSLRNELGTAQNIDIPGGTIVDGKLTGNCITYYSPARGTFSQIYVEDSGKAVMFRRYYSEDVPGTANPAEQLISDTVATGDLFVTFASVSYADGVITFNELSVDRRSGSTGLAERDSLSIRVI